MRIITVLFLFLIILPISHAGEGSGGGGPRPSRDLQFILNKVQAGPGGGGGTPFSSEEIILINSIDNIEVFDEVKFPETFKQKIDLLRKSEVQSIQLNDGQIISN